jgi:hypothetical protein
MIKKPVVRSVVGIGSTLGPEEAVLKLKIEMGGPISDLESAD